MSRWEAAFKRHSVTLAQLRAVCGQVETGRELHYGVRLPCSTAYWALHAARRVPAWLAPRRHRPFPPRCRRR
jgi:hypothetical protein